jgi:hypothetical protein
MEPLDHFDGVVEAGFACSSCDCLCACAACNCSQYSEIARDIVRVETKLMVREEITAVSRQTF